MKLQDGKYTKRESKGEIFVRISPKKIISDSLSKFQSDISDIVENVAENKKLTVDISGFKFSGVQNDGDFYRDRANYIIFRIASNNHNVSVKLPPCFYERLKLYQGLNKLFKPTGKNYVLNFGYK